MGKRFFGPSAEAGFQVLQVLRGRCTHAGHRKWFDGHGNYVNHYAVAFTVNTSNPNRTHVGDFTVSGSALQQIRKN